MLRWLDRLEEALIATLIALATTIIFFAVLHRYSLSGLAGLLGWARTNDMPALFEASKSAFNAVRSISFTWAQELTIYMFIWMAKFGAAYGVRTGIHVGVDVLVNALKPAQRNFFILLGLLAGALFTSIIGSLGAYFVWELFHTEQVSPDLELPMWIVYLAMPLGSYLMCFRFMQVAYSFYRTGELPHHDHGHVEGLTEEAQA
jgi:C4-dicarboxylate transporter DctQ subunit